MRKIDKRKGVNDVEELMNLLNGLGPKQHKRDRWRWFLNEDGEFKFKTLKAMVDEKELDNQRTFLDTKWIRFLPRKINIFVWRLSQGRIPTIAVLDHVGIDLNSLFCPCCLDVVETVEHCMTRRKWVDVGWAKIFKRWNVKFSSGWSIHELLSHEGHQSFSTKQRCLWQTII